MDMTLMESLCVVAASIYLVINGHVYDSFKTDESHFPETVHSCLKEKTIIWRERKKTEAFKLIKIEPMMEMWYQRRDKQFLVLFYTTFSDHHEAEKKYK